MKTIGLLGGLTCESSLVYYRLINEMAREKLGGNHSAASVMVSVDFGKVQPLTERGDWNGVLAILLQAAKEIKKAGFSKVGLLGTRFTMEEDFFKGRLREKHGIETIVPGKEERERVHRIIIDELALGVIKPASREEVRKVSAALIANGVQAVILGCTELPLLITQKQVQIPLFDTTKIHARAAVDYALGI